MPYLHPSSNKDLSCQQQLTMGCCWDVCTKISLGALILFYFFKNGKMYNGVILGEEVPWLL